MKKQKLRVIWSPKVPANRAFHLKPEACPLPYVVFDILEGLDIARMPFTRVIEPVIPCILLKRLNIGEFLRGRLWES